MACRTQESSLFSKNGIFAMPITRTVHAMDRAYESVWLMDFIGYIRTSCRNMSRQNPLSGHFHISIFPSDLEDNKFFS